MRDLSSVTLADVDRAFFETFGFVALPGSFDPAGLAVEIRQALTDAFPEGAHRNTGPAENQFRYVPMMVDRTPVSLALTVQFAAIAAELLGSAVLPGRSKGTEYHGSTSWHRDTETPPRSIGVLCYLDHLDRDTGALTVVPGSHHPGFGAAVAGRIAAGASGDPADGDFIPATSLETTPGDAIIFDERLFHASSGGEARLQWRVDFVADTADEQPLIGFYERQHRVGWDGGYDIDRYPSYGQEWQARNPIWSDRLRELGVFDMVSAEEAWVRQHR